MYIHILQGAGSYICQYDIGENTPGAIIASETYLGPCEFSHLKLGPDKKVYFLSIMNSQLGVINLPDDSGRACQYEVSIPVQISAKGISGVVGSFPNVVPIFKRDTVYNTQTYTLPCFKKSQLKLYAPVLGTDYIWEDGSINTEHIVTSSGKYWVSYNSAPCIRHIDTFNVIMPGSFVPLYGFIKQSCRGIKDGLAWIHPANGDTIQYIYTWFDTGGNILQKNTF